MRHGERYRKRQREQRRQEGFTFIAVLALLALIMLGLAAVGPLWAQQAQREREQDLLRIGALYAQAIASYRDSSPGSVKQYPQQLDALVHDSRFIGVTRHLRRLYSDPIAPELPWGLVRDAGGRIIGVYSQSDKAPLAQAAIDLGVVQLAPVKRYADWKFMPKVKS